MRITLASIDHHTIADAFNAVYDGYVIPVHVDDSWAEQHVSSTDIVLADSPLWLDADGAIIAMAMLGVRADRAWLGGFGIAPPYRGRGLSHQLIHEVIERGRRLRLREIVLEVITTNTAAIRTYQRAGFTHHRDLLILQRKPNGHTPDVDTTAVTTANPANLLANRPQSAAVPAWQRDHRSLSHDPGLAGLTLGPDDSPLAMAVYHATGATVHIADLAATDANSAQTLLTVLIQRNPTKPISLINEPDTSNTLPALNALGWQEVMRQHELILALE